MDDRTFDCLSPFLKAIVIQKVSDIRILFKNFKKTVERSLDENRLIPEFSPLDLIEL